MKILQWNCRGIKNKIEDLRNIAQDYDIIALQETWLDDGSYINIGNFNIERNDRQATHHGGGTLIAINKNIIYDKINIDFSSFNNFEIQTIKVKAKQDSSTYITNIYKPPQIKATNKTWYKLLNKIGNISNFKKHIICGDFNANHRTWGSKIDNPTGKNLIIAVNKLDLEIIPKKEPTMIPKINYRPSAPDLQIVTLDLFSNFIVNNIIDPMNSDHHPMMIETNFQPQVFTSDRSKLTTTKVDWLKTQEDLKKTTFKSKIIKANHLDEYKTLVNNIQDILINNGAKKINNQNTTCNSHIGTTKKHKNTRPALRWWNDKCQEAIISRKTAYLNFKNLPTNENLITWRDEINKTRKIIKNEKSNSFKETIDKINPNTKLKDIWNIIKSFKNSKIWNAPNNNNTTEEQIKAAKIYTEKFAPPSTANYVHISNNSMELPSIWRQEVTVEEIKVIIKDLKSHTAPGFDNISNEILKNLPDNIIDRLRDIIAIIIEEGEIPPDWKIYNTTLIPKQKKNSYRPISLASNILKLTEKIIKNRLDHYIENDLIIPSIQFGFRKNKSCQDSLNLFTTEIYQAFLKRESLGALFVDVEGAFDNVNPSILINELKKLKIPSNILKFIQNAITERTVHFYLNGTHIDTRICRKGLPQGSILSPLLFNIYIHKILSHSGNNCSILQFADDIVIYCKNADKLILKRNLTESINTLQEWLTSINLNISAEKTKLVIFSKKRNSQDFNVDIEGKTVSPTKEAKFLGLTMDSKLNWLSHIKYLKERIIKATTILKWLSGVYWGAHPETLLIIYKATIRAMIEWGLPQYINAPKTNLKSINSLTQSALKKMSGTDAINP